MPYAGTDSNDETHEVDLMSVELTYIHLPPGSPFPVLPCLRSRVVVVVRAEVSPEWQMLASQWIIDIGCLYMMAWGIDCTSWDDSVDYAHLEKYDYDCERIPEDDFVLTTWHDDEPLSEVFRYAKGELEHPYFELKRTIILDIAEDDRSVQFVQEYIEA
jgi:hypothetical protein